MEISVKFTARSWRWRFAPLRAQRPNEQERTSTRAPSLRWQAQLAGRTVRVVAVLLLVFNTGPAFAYLDPGTASIILQSVIGAAAAGLFAGKMYFSQIKSFFTRNAKQPDAIEDEETLDEEHR